MRVAKQSEIPHRARVILDLEDFLELVGVVADELVLEWKMSKLYTPERLREREGRFTRFAKFQSMYEDFGYTLCPVISLMRPDSR